MTLAKTPEHYLAAEILAAQQFRETVPQTNNLTISRILETDLYAIPAEQRKVFLDKYFETLERNAPCNQPVRLIRPDIIKSKLVGQIVVDGLRQLAIYKSPEVATKQNPIKTRGPTIDTK